LSHITYEWSGVVDSYVVVVSPQNERQIRGHLKEVKRGVEFVTQPAPAGLADAILCAEPYVKGKFIVHLGDCIFRGKFEEEDANFDLGIGVWKTYDLDEINKSYLVGVSPATGLVEDVIEKPNTTRQHGNCGMGVYFLDERIFDYIRRYEGPPGGGDFTSILQTMVDEGEKIVPVWFRGDYINITTPDDVKKAERIFR